MEARKKEGRVGVWLVMVGSLLLWLGCGPKSEGEEGCKDGLKMCGSPCVSTDEDGNNCGVCDVACTTGQSCMDGNCQEPDGGDGKETCKDELHRCGGECTDMTKDVNNCGECGITCTTGQSCMDGNCQEPDVGSIELDGELRNCILAMNGITKKTLVREVKEINCPNQNIKSAQGLQPFVQLERLYLTNNKIGEIKANTFAGLTKLERLYLGGNQIKEIKANAFDGLPNLQELHLYSNKITTIAADIFAGLTKLEWLDLSGNEIGEIEKDTFAGLENLLGLYLSGNQITTIAADIFDGLENLLGLYLTNNKIKEIKANTFAGLENLKTLSLRGNQISTIAADIFAGLTKLERLYLYGNRDGEGEPTLLCKSLSALLKKLSESTSHPFVYLEDATASYDYSETQSEDSLRTARYCKRD